MSEVAKDAQCGSAGMRVLILYTGDRRAESAGLLECGMSCIASEADDPRRW
jgi:hypothetical protein